jgi:hypothetical protein
MICSLKDVIAINLKIMECMKKFCKRVYEVIDILSEEMESMFFMVMFGMLSFYSIILIYDLFFVENVFNKTAQSTILINLIFDLVILSYFYHKISSIIGKSKICTFDIIKKNKNRIHSLSLSNAKELLIHCIEIEEYEFAELLKQRIKNLNEEISVNKSI